MLKFPKRLRIWHKFCTFAAGMENQRENIIQSAAEKMRVAGIRSVSIDDICRDLGMSKKTFYVYFETKDDLISELLHRKEQTLYDDVVRQSKGKSIADLLVHSMKIAKSGEDVRQMPSLYYDLKKYYPQQFEAHLQRLEERNQELLTRFLTRGKQEGIFREDFDVELTAILLAKLHQNMLNKLTTAKDKNLVARVSKYGVDLIFRGLISEEGKQMIESKLNK